MISSTHSPITFEWFVENEKLILEHPVLQQMVGKIAEIEKSEGRRKAENEILQFGLARIAAVALDSTSFSTPVDLKSNMVKIKAIAGEIQKGLESIASAYG